MNRYRWPCLLAALAILGPAATALLADEPPKAAARVSSAILSEQELSSR